LVRKEATRPRIVCRSSTMQRELEQETEICIIFARRKLIGGIGAVGKLR